MLDMQLSSVSKSILEKIKQNLNYADFSQF